MATVKKMTFKLVGPYNTYILSCLTNGKIWLSSEDNRPFSLSNVMFRSTVTANGYKEQEKCLKEALRAVIGTGDKKNADKVLSTLKKVTNLSTWTVLASNVSIEVKDVVEETVKKMSFKLVGPYNTYILSCLTNGKIWLSSEDNRPFSLSNVMFRSTVTANGYKEQEKCLKESLKTVISAGDKKNADKVLSVLKQVTNLSAWTVLNYDLPIKIKS